VRGGSAVFLGAATLPVGSPALAAGGQIGVTLPLGGRVDDFAGGTVP
jgi:hypothetical protein